MTGNSAFDVADLIEKVVQPLAPTQHRLVIEAVPADVQPEKVHAVALVLHELGTNAIKHGAWAGDAAWFTSGSPDDGKVCLQWTEDGVCHPGTGIGFGTLLIARRHP